ncbi:nucleoside hydrolase [Micromonospora inositola]|uniref:Purine nucleosidase n=1 Tax=Micromonospora inositola TaxID=47865 RepID=A0A1C5JNN1_9ACTN|nr:nucleoside hydrolase [Micromonospora inositola]SCG72202.1 purine nucleosidase [Micromonospora inositola]
MQNPVHTVILDTDIGTDVDDAMALAQILGSPEIYLDSVTTVYGDTTLRAQIAHRYGTLAGRELRVHAGRTTPRTGREVYWPGHEGSLHDDLADARVEPTDAVDHLIARLGQAPGQFDVIAIGPLANIAAALEREPRIAQWIHHLWIMGGDFGDPGEAEHNFLSDSRSTQLVLTAGIPTTITGLDVTRQLQIRSDGLERVGAAGPLGQALRADMTQWWEFWQKEWNVPHDPVTVLTLTHPELFTFSGPGRVEVSTSRADEGTSRFVSDVNGTTRISLSVDAESAAEEIISAIERAGRAAPQSGAPHAHSA